MTGTFLVRLALAFGVFAQASLAQIGPAPKVDAMPDIPEMPPHVQAKLLSPISVNVFNRADVVRLYFQVFTPTPAMGWTGSITGPFSPPASPVCNAGDTSQAYKDATLDRVNYYRAQAGLPGNLTLDPTMSAQDQEMAVMITANSASSHSPPATWACYTAGGALAASKSNLAGGVSGPEAIDGYMDDEGGGNYFVGHRRWILFPPQTAVGTGSTPNMYPPYGPTANALWVLGPFGTRPSTPNGVAWPAPGFAPYYALPWSSNRWSFSYPSANFAAANVTVKKAGVSLPLSVASRTDTGYGDNTIVWNLFELDAPPKADTSYDVTVSGITGAPQTSYTYTTTVIDPYKNPALRRDLDGDRFSDLAWKHTSGVYFAWLINYDFYTPAGIGAVGIDWQLVANMDINGDGKADLIWFQPSTGAVYAWLLNGSAVTGVIPLGSVGPSSGWTPIGWGDLAGQARGALVWRHAGSGTLVAWLINGASVTAQVIGAIGSSWVLAGTGDINADGMSDLIWFEPTTGAVYAWLMSGASVSSVVPIGSVGASSGWSISRVDDFNGDGRADLFWRHASGTNVIWYVNGASVSSVVLLPGVAPGWDVVASGDYDDDGTADILWRHATSGTVVQWFMRNGGSNPWSVSTLGAVDATWSVAGQ